MIEVNNLTKHYGKQRALSNVSLKVEKGSSFALLGRNGAGKTTLVKSVLGLLPIEKGTITLNGMSATDHLSRQHVSYLPEKFTFFPYYTLFGLCDFYGKVKGLDKRTRRQQAEQALERLNLSEYGNKKVNECSKGQLQRAGLAAMLMGDNELLILDEPFSGLDPIAVKELQELLIALRDEGKTVIINSHDLDHVQRICDTMAILDKGECVVSGNIDKLVGEKDILDYFVEQVEGRS